MISVLSPSNVGSFMPLAVKILTVESFIVLAIGRLTTGESI